MNTATLSTWGYLTEPAQTTGHRYDLCNLPASDWRWWVWSFLTVKLGPCAATCDWSLHRVALLQALLPLHSPYTLKASVPTSAQTPNAHPHLLLFITCFLPTLRGSPIVCSAVPDKVPVWLMELTSLLFEGQPTTSPVRSEPIPWIFTLNPRMSHRVYFYLVVTFLLQWIGVTYCVIPISWAKKDYYRIGTGRSPKRQIPR